MRNYADRREYMREYQQTWVAKRRAEWLTGRSCVICGAEEDLEVDHVDRSTKVSHTIWSWSQARRDAELAKCQVLCRACHRAKTVHEIHERVGYADHGTSLYRKGCRCAVCRRAITVQKREWRARRSASQDGAN